MFQTSYTPEQEGAMRQAAVAKLNPEYRPLQKSKSTMMQPHALRVCPRLWMSDLYTATKRDILDHLQINHIVAISHKNDNALLFFPDHISTSHVDWDGEGQIDLSKVTSLISDKLSQKCKVLICSLGGCSRSGVVALAALASLMGKEDLFLVQNLLVRRRPQVINYSTGENLKRHWQASAEVRKLEIEQIFNNTYPQQAQSAAGALEEKHSPVVDPDTEEEYSQVTGYDYDTDKAGGDQPDSSEPA